jgi:hypothetical protein
MKLQESITKTPASIRAPVDIRTYGERVAILSDGWWRRPFGAAAALVERTVSLNDNSYTVVGVSPPGFQYGDEPLDWYPPPQRTTLSRRTTGA